MRSDEIENAYPGLAPPPAQARLDFREGRCPFAGSPALLEALARAASAAGVTALGAAAGREAAGGAGELRRRSAARGAGGGGENPGIVGRILRQDPLHWPGKVYAGIRRRSFITAHGLRSRPASPTVRT